MHGLEFKPDFCDAVLEDFAQAGAVWLAAVFACLAVFVVTVDCAITVFGGSVGGVAYVVEQFGGFSVDCGGIAVGFVWRVLFKFGGD